ncbi:MAG: PDR/VanB family oxidoreductase [Rhizobiaceae bacterium]
MAERSFDLTILQKDTVADGVVRFTLARKDGGQLLEWQPGAHIDVHFVSNGQDCVRHYSLCGSPSDRSRWQIAVLRVKEGRGGSAHIHDAFAEGDTVRVTGPRNNFPLVPASPYLFIAGGIGITPMLSMVEAASAAGRDWRLVYCGRSETSMAFAQHLVSSAGDKVLLHTSDTHGLIDLSALIAASAPDTVVYCCGPSSMIDAVRENCSAWSPDRVHFERFTGSEPVAADANSSFEVEFARSGLVLTVPPDRSILAMAEDAGVDIDSSCQEGVCGTCETRVLSGTPDHRDSVLSARERAAGKTMMVCVSRSCSARLVLDA